MKLKFKNQPFQTDAVNAVADLFAGRRRTPRRSIVEESQRNLFNEFGVGNALYLPDDAILADMREVQRRNLRQTSG